MFEGIGNALGCLAVIAIVGVIGTVGFAGYAIYDKTGAQTYESKTIIKPDYRLEASGKKIDTIYIYKFKK
jgi:hypothetical protein